MLVAIPPALPTGGRGIIIISYCHKSPAVYSLFHLLTSGCISTALSRHSICNNAVRLNAVLIRDTLSLNVSDFFITETGAVQSLQSPPKVTSTVSSLREKQHQFLISSSHPALQYRKFGGSRQVPFYGV